MSNEYKDWLNDEIADLNYCLNRMYECLDNIFNTLYDDYETDNDDVLKSIMKVLDNIDSSIENNRENINCLNNIVTQEYILLRKIFFNPWMQKYGFSKDIEDLLKNVEYLRGDFLEIK